MSSDDQHFLDILSSIPHDLQRYSVDLADWFDVKTDHAGLFIRDVWLSQTWLPDSVKPQKPAPHKFSPRKVIPRGLYASTRDWIWRHQAITISTLAFLSTGGFLLYHRRKAYIRKRRARRGDNGSRLEVVVVAGTSQAPVTRSLIHDLERRGFIVYVVASTLVEEQQIKAEGKSDIIPLHLNVADTSDVRLTMERFEQLFSNPDSHLTFAGLILVPDMTYPVGPVETMSMDLFSDALTAKVLGTVATAQAFLRTICENKSQVVMLTPSIISSLRPAFHVAESTIVAALDSFTATLASELSTLDINVSHIKFGSLDSGNFTAANALQRDQRAEVLTWPSFARKAFAQNFLAQRDDREGDRLLSRKRRGSPLRELNNAVFDTLERRHWRSVIRVGQGSLMYGLIGSMAPSGLVNWMLGLHRVSLEKSPRTSDSAQWERVDRPGL